MRRWRPRVALQIKTRAGCCGVLAVVCSGRLARRSLLTHEAEADRGCSPRGRIFVLSLSGAADRLANDEVAGMQGLELPRGSLAASYLGTGEL